MGGESFNIYCFVFAVYFIELFRAAQTPSKRFFCTLAIILCVAQSAYAGMSEGTVANYFMICAYLMIRTSWVPWKQFWHSGFWIFTIFFISLLLSAPYLSILYYNSTLMTTGHVIGHITIPLHYLPDLFLPYFRGWVLNDYFTQTFPNQLNVIFLGLIPLIAFLLWLSHYSCFADSKKWLAFFLIILFYLSQAFGSEFFSLNIVGAIPIVNKVFFFRFFPTLFVFAVCLLTAKVFHDLQTHKLAQIRYRFILLLWIGVALYFVYLFHTSNLVAEIHQKPSLSQQFIDWNKTNSIWVLGFAFFFSLWAPWLQKYRWNAWFREKWSVLFVGLVFLSCSYHFSKSYYHQQDAFEETPVVAFLKQKLQQGELFRIYSPNQYFPSTAAGYGLPDIRYMLPVVPQNTIDVLNYVFGDYAKGQVRFDRFESLKELDHAHTYDHPGFDLLNVRYLIFQPTHQALPHSLLYNEIYRSEKAVILENLDAKERVFLVDQWKIFSEKTQLLHTIRDAPHKLLSTAYLLDAPQWPSWNLPQASSNHPPQLLEWKNHSYRLKIQLTQPQFLVISDIYYDGFKAYINEQPLSVQPVNGGLIGIAVPAGEYQLTLRLEHPFFLPSLWLFALGIVLVGILYFVKKQTLFPNFTK